MTATCAGAAENKLKGFLLHGASNVEHHVVMNANQPRTVIFA